MVLKNSFTYLSGRNPTSIKSISFIFNLFEFKPSFIAFIETPLYVSFYYISLAQQQIRFFHLLLLQRVCPKFKPKTFILNY